MRVLKSKPISRIERSQVKTDEPWYAALFTLCDMQRATTTYRHEWPMSILKNATVILSNMA